MEISIAEIVGFGVIIATQIGQTIKGLSESKVIQAELRNLVQRIDRQNGRINKLENGASDHVEKFHTIK